MYVCLCIWTCVCVLTSRHGVLSTVGGWVLCSSVLIRNDFGATTLTLIGDTEYGERRKEFLPIGTVSDGSPSVEGCVTWDVVWVRRKVCHSTEKVSFR